MAYRSGLVSDHVKHSPHYVSDRQLCTGMCFALKGSHAFLILLNMALQALAELMKAAGVKITTVLLVQGYYQGAWPPAAVCPTP